MSYPAYIQDPAAATKAPNETHDFGEPMPYRLRRPGARPLVFSGTELAMAMSYTPELPYWYEINIYRTDTQRFVLAIRLFFQSEDEENIVQAWDFDEISEVFDAIEHYDAGNDVKVSFVDFPAATPVDMSAMALELRARAAAARANYAGLVGELFEELLDATH